MSEFQEKPAPEDSSDLPVGNSSSAHDVSTTDPSDLSDAAERALIRKLDLQLIPIIVLLYLFSFLDRGFPSPTLNSSGL
jgi:hypothetical protein